MLKKLKTVDGATLMAARLPPIRYVIEGLLPQGLHLLAGAPKVGKSWLALWLCLCVAKGYPVWGFAAGQSDVLYLCLEDSYTTIDELTPELLRLFIQRIEIGERAKKHSHSSSQCIRINYRDIGVVDSPMQGGEQEPHIAEEITSKEQIMKLLA